MLQQRQQYYVTRYAHDYDRTNIEAVQSYEQTRRGMMYQGKSVTEAEEMAAISTKGKVQVQATLSAVKEMAGWTGYACIICALVTVLVPWKKRDISHDTREYLTKMEN